MLSKEDNEALTRVGPGTLMGDLFRRFWLPALLVKEIQEHDGVPVRLRILGEDLLAFRDTDGKVGIVEAYCSHRRAPLFFGRNEEGGVRCPYHGWKFDTNGACLEMPNVPGNRDLTAVRAKMGIAAYATREAGGLVWVYMGPKDKKPAFPALEWTALPADQVHVSRWLQRSNFMQGVEGEIDTSHISFLHKDFDLDNSPLKGFGAILATDGAPDITLKEKPYGFTYGARRHLDGKHFWRVTQWLLPMYSLIPRNPNEQFTIGAGRAWVPVDDDNVTTFAYTFRVDRPISAEEVAVLESGKLFPPRMERGTVQLNAGHRFDTYLPTANGANDYLVDREMQKSINFSGIWGANEQDRALQESMGGATGASSRTVDRSLEHLVAADQAIVTARRMLLKMARDVRNGVDPAPLQDGSLYAVRAVSRICDITDFDEFLAHYGQHMNAAPQDSTLANGA